ncbi:hypothetical protein [Methyloglobulus sp.]|uniref:hypothetical protein n=1 Tax=Methyloglobulus sp. TaxID=2518622 RepID=UPI0032B82798
MNRCQPVGLSQASNGAGKTMFALEYFPMVAGCRRFINGDLIAAGLSPLAPRPFTGCQPLVLA